MRQTIFSPDRVYRYVLWRQWGDDNYVMFVGLNPSTADELKDDPTIRKCIRFARKWGFGSLCMTNIFAFRATNPEIMKQAIDPVGPDNDKHLQELHQKAGLIVACWGKHGAHGGRATKVREFLPDMKCFKINKDGSPMHPLYVPYITELIDL